MMCMVAVCIMRASASEPRGPGSGIWACGLPQRKRACTARMWVSWRSAATWPTCAHTHTPTCAHPRTPTRPPARAHAQAVVIGAALSLSSSAFVLQLLNERGEMSTRLGSATLGILLLQARGVAGWLAGGLCVCMCACV